jgi:hypothetical protein
VIKPYGESSNPDKDRYIFEDGCLTLATVEAAKGYDSPVVFLMGVDLFGDNVEARARFYVGATRAKMHLFVSGIRSKGGFAEETEAVSKLLATREPSFEASPPTSIQKKNTASTMSNRIDAVGCGSKRPEQAKLAIRPVPVTQSVLQAFTPLFRRGDTVQHSRYGVGRVVQDGARKYLSSQDRWTEDVRVQFGGTIKKLEAGSDRLVHLEHGKK